MHECGVISKENVDSDNEKWKKVKGVEYFELIIYHN